MLLVTGATNHTYSELDPLILPSRLSLITPLSPSRLTTVCTAIPVPSLSGTTLGGACRAAALASPAAKVFCEACVTSRSALCSCRGGEGSRRRMEGERRGGEDRGREGEQTREIQTREIQTREIQTREIQTREMGARDQKGRFRV